MRKTKNNAEEKKQNFNYTFKRCALRIAREIFSIKSFFLIKRLEAIAEIKLIETIENDERSFNDE